MNLDTPCSRNKFWSVVVIILCALPWSCSQGRRNRSTDENQSTIEKQSDFVESRAKRLTAESVSGHIIEYNDARREGRLKDALSIAEVLVEGGTPVGYFNGMLGDILFSLGDRQGAVRECTVFLEYARNEDEKREELLAAIANTLSNRARCFVDLNQPDAADRDFRESEAAAKTLKQLKK